MMISSVNATNTLEIGAGDYSFEYCSKKNDHRWVNMDWAPPCDIMCDFNSHDVLFPFEDRSFDLVICTEVLEHVLWPHRLLKEANRVLSDNGNILISVPNIASLTYRIAWLLGRIPSCAASGNLPRSIGSTAYEKEENLFIGGHVIDFNLRKITDLLLYAGFQIVRTKGSGIIWYWQLLPYWAVPTGLASNIICLAKKAHSPVAGI
jgi:SAM-dependent methyltransferase